MGNGACGFARAAEYYFGRQLATFTIDDADKAALLAGIAVASRLRAERQGRGPRPAPPKPDADADAGEWVPVTRGNGAAVSRALDVVRRDTPTSLAPAVVEHVLEELPVRHAGIGVEISCRDESRSTRQRTRAYSRSSTTRWSTASPATKSGIRGRLG